MLGLAGGLLAAAGGFDMKVGDVPRLDEPPDGIGGLEAFELAEPLDCQYVGGIERLVFAGELFVGLVEVLLIGDGVAAPLFKIKEVVRLAVTAAFVPEDFAFNKRGPFFLADLKGVSDEPVDADNVHAVLEFDENGVLLCIAANNLLKTAAGVESLADVSFEAIVEESEDIEERGLSRTVGADDDAEVG